MFGISIDTRRFLMSFQTWMGGIAMLWVVAVFGMAMRLKYLGAAADLTERNVGWVVFLCAIAYCVIAGIISGPLNRKLEALRQADFAYMRAHPSRNCSSAC